MKKLNRFLPPVSRKRDLEQIFDSNLERKSPVQGTSKNGSIDQKKLSNSIPSTLRSHQRLLNRKQRRRSLQVIKTFIVPTAHILKLFSRMRLTIQTSTVLQSHVLILLKLTYQTKTSFQTSPRLLTSLLLAVRYEERELWPMTRTHSKRQSTGFSPGGEVELLVGNIPVG